MDLLASAETELADIERKIAEIQPLMQRRDQLRMFISVGRTLYATPQGQTSMLPALVSDAPTSLYARARAGVTQKDRIIEAAAALIAVRGPMQTKDLVRQIQEQGIEVGGADKLVSMSVLMSRAKDKFKSDRAAGGWVLLQSSKEATPPGAQTPAGS